MRHRCLLGAREISTLAKSVSIDNHEPLAKSKLELLTTLCSWAPRRLCRGQSRRDLALVKRPCGGTYQSPKNVETPNVWPSAPRSPQPPLRTCSRRGASPGCPLACTDTGGCRSRVATRSILKGGGSHGLAGCIYLL